MRINGIIRACYLLGITGLLFLFSFWQISHKTAAQGVSGDEHNKLREDAYRAVQRNAMETWNGNGAFLDLLKADKDIATYLANDEIELVPGPGFPPRAGSQAVSPDDRTGDEQRASRRRRRPATLLPS